MGTKKHKDKDREHRKKHKHRERSGSREKHRSKRTKAEKEERKARKRAAKLLAEGGNIDSDLVTEIDYGHGYQAQPEPGEIEYEYNYVESTENRDVQERDASPTVINDDAPVQSNTSDNSLSIADTNKLRAKLGLKPLEVAIPGVTGEGSGGTQEDVHAPAVNISEVKRTEKIKERTEASRSKRAYEAKLSKIKGLGDSDSDEDDAFGWVKKSRIKQREKELAAKREKILDEMDAEFGLADLVEEEFSSVPKNKYTENDLHGLTVQHTLERFQEGSSVIMTLDDKGVLDDGDDILVNVNMADDERVDKNLENKKRGPNYNPYDNAEEDEFGLVKQKKMLAKYDEEIHGAKKESFTLGSRGKYEGSHEKAMSQIREDLQNQRQSLTINAPQLASEYFTTDEMNAKFKKKKKVRRKVRAKATLTADDLLGDLDGDVVHHGSRSRGRGLNPESAEIPGLDAPLPPLAEQDIKEEEECTVYRSNDDPLYNTQSETTQAAYTYYDGGGDDGWTEQDTFIPPSEIKTEVKSDPDSDSDTGPLEDLSGVKIDPDDAESELQAALDKTRRLRQMRYREKPDAKVYNQLARIRRKVKVEPTDDHDGDKKNSIVLNSISEFCRSLGDIPTYGQSGNREDDEDLMDLELDAESKLTEEEMTGWNEVDIDTKPVDITEDDENILNDEPIVNTGLGTALSLAVQKGYLDQEGTRQASFKQSKIHVENYSIEDKRYDDLEEKTHRQQSHRDRFTGPVSDFKDKSGYKPDIKLEYMDDKGQLLSNKEAFRYLSHRFHGKGSGKKKTEKRGKKFDEDLMMKSMSSIDTPLGTLNLLKDKQKSEKSPYVILTGVSSNKAFMA